MLQDRIIYISIRMHSEATQVRYDVVRQLTVEQSLNQTHPDLNRTAQTSVQIYKGGSNRSATVRLL